MVTESINFSLECMTRVLKIHGVLKGNTFLLFDYVHLLKNISNNWITEKTFLLKCPNYERWQ